MSADLTLAEALDNAWRLLAAARVPTRPTCGTYAGVSVHNREGEPVCEDCQAAHATYQAMRRRRLALGMSMRGDDLDPEPPRWFEIAGDLPTVGATIRRAFLEGA